MRVLVLAVLMLLSVSGVGAQDDLPPYIHYFDPLRGGLVIERADGTDSRMIADVPPGHIEWSPSGKWMVIGHKMIVSTDGSKRLPDPLLALIGYYPQTLWSPKDDVILAIGFEATSRSVFAQLYDVEAQAILASFEFQNPTFGEGSLDLYWEPDGTRAFVSWPGGVLTLYRDGQTAMWVDSIHRYGAADFYLGRLFSVAGRTDEVLMLRIGALNGEKQIDIEDRIELSRNTYSVRWSPTLEHALIYAQKCSDTHCGGWLKLVDWESSEVATVTPTIGISPRGRDCYGYFCTELWSPDGRYAVLSQRSDNARNIYILDVTTATTRQIATHEPVTWYGWSPDGLLYIMREGRLNIVAYDPATDDKSIIDLPLGTQPYQLSISPTGQYLGLSTASAMVIDESGTVVVEEIRHSHSTQSYSYPYGYTWHPDGQWLMANYVISFAGGGNGPIAAVLFDIDGTTRRELPTGGRAGFVPDQAIPHLAPGQPTSVKKAPIFILPQKGIVDGVGWHPNDPDQLVTHSREDGLIFWSLAGSQPEIIRHEILAFPFPAPLPVGIRLFWMPERDVVAFWDGRPMVTIDQATGEAVPVEGVDSPCSRSNRVPQIETALPLVSCGQTGLLYWALTSDRVLTYANKETGVITPLDTGGRTDHIWTGDARNGVAAVGGIWDCCIAIASTETGALLDELHGTAYHLAISADGRRLATTSAGMTAIWDISEYIGEE